MYGTAEIRPNLSLSVQFNGTWYWLYHIPQKYNEELDCPVSKIEALNRKSGRITTSAYVKK
jgi:hypothetical protein